MCKYNGREKQYYPAARKLARLLRAELEFFSPRETNKSAKSAPGLSCGPSLPWLLGGGGTIFHSPPFSSRCSFSDNNGRIQMLICRDYFMGGRAAKWCKDFVCEWWRCNPTPAAALVRCARVFLTCWQITKVQEKIKRCQRAAASLGTTPEQAPSSPG